MTKMDMERLMGGFGLSSLIKEENVIIDDLFHNQLNYSLVMLHQLLQLTSLHSIISS